MSGANGVAVTTFSDGLFKKSIEVASVFCNSGFIKNGDRVDVSVLVEVSNMFESECCWFCDGAGMETQITLNGVNCALIRDDFEFPGHGEILTTKPANHQ